MFANTKHNRGITRFHRCGRAAVRTEWRPACPSDSSTPQRLAAAGSAYLRRASRLHAALHHEGVTTVAPGDGWNVWVPLAGDESFVVDKLAGQGWQVPPGSAYAVDPARSDAALRIMVSTLSEHDAAQFADVLAGVLQDAASRPDAQRERRT